MVKGQYPQMIQYSDLEGLPSATVYDIVQGPNGYLWFGTANGLTRFDGKNFRSYHSQQMIGREVLDVNIDPSGRIWFSTFFGHLYHLADDTIKEFEHPSIGTSQKVMSFYPDSEGSIWVGTHHNILRFAPNEDDKFDLSQKIPCISRAHSHNIVESPDGNIWAIRIMADGEGVALLKARENKFLPLERAKKNTVLTLASLRSGRLCLFSRQKNADICLIENEKPFPILKEYGKLFSQGIICVYEDANGWLWIGTKDGVHLFDENLELVNTDKPYLKGIPVNEVFQDSEGNYWFGTDGQGLFFLSNFDVSSYTAENSELKNNHIFSIANTKSGEVFLGLANGHLVTLDKSSMSSLLIPSTARITTLRYDESSGSLFAGTDSDLFRISGTNIKSYGVNAAIKQIRFGGDKSLLIASGDRAMQFDVRTGQSKILIHERSYSIFEDERGTIWIGGLSGLWTHKNGKSELFRSGSGQPLNFRITDFDQTDEATIWIATFGNGLIKLSGNEYTRLDSDDGLSSNVCTDLYADGADLLWVGTDKGLNKFHINTGEFEQIKTLDGLLSNEINQIQRSGDKIFIGTPKGANSFNIATNFKDTVHPKIFFTNLSINGNETAIKESFELKPQQKQILIEFTGISFKSRDDTYYKYKMAGLDSAWTVSKEQSVHYRALNPGRYTFQVKAINADGAESVAPASIDFEIQTPFLASVWFKVLLGLGVLSLVGLTMFFTIRTVNRKRRFELAVNEKIDELRMQALQSQMNPHFVFNALNAILHLLSVNDKKSAMKYLAMFARLIRLIFEHSKKKTIPLNSEIEFLQLYLELEKLRFEEKIDIKLEVDENLRTHQIKIPPLLIQPIIENSFKHGLLHKEQGGELSIKFSKDGNFLLCSVEDNGIGREEAERIGSWKPKGYRSSGLKTTKERLSLLNKSKNGNKGSIVSLQIEDLVGANGEASGTKVDLQIEIDE